MKEVIELNQHRLLCGDATNKEDVDLLIGNCKVDLLLTDPPYGIDIVNVDRERERESIWNNWRSETSNIPQGTVGTPAKPGFHKERERELLKAKSENPGIVKPRMYYPIANDDKPFHPHHLLALNLPSILFGANNYSDELPRNSKWLVWYKKEKLDSKKNNFSDVELMWTNLKGKACYLYHHSWSGMVRAGNRKEELKERVHPTQKPVGLYCELLEDFTQEGDTVLDLYGGSGSLLIACEKMGRRCLMMELSPHYCDVIQKRYWDYVGKGQSKLL